MCDFIIKEKHNFLFLGKFKSVFWIVGPLKCTKIIDHICLPLATKLGKLKGSFHTVYDTFVVTLSYKEVISTQTKSYFILLNYWYQITKSNLNLRKKWR